MTEGLLLILSLFLSTFVPPFFSQLSLLIKILKMTKDDTRHVGPNQVYNFSKLLKCCKISFQIHFLQYHIITNFMKNWCHCERIATALPEELWRIHGREWPWSFMPKCHIVNPFLLKWQLVWGFEDDAREPSDSCRTCDPAGNLELVLMCSY